MPDIFEDFTLRQIDQKDHTAKFSLGNANHTPLKIFLQKNALDFHQYQIAKTFVFAHQRSSPSTVLGYITLMNSEIALDEKYRPNETSATLKYSAFPAIKIARLAVDKTLQGKGVGRALLDWCVNHAQFTIMPHVGCRFLVVDAKRNSIPFYEKNGFTLLNADSNQADEHPSMFFDLYKKN